MFGRRSVPPAITFTCPWNLESNEIASSRLRGEWYSNGGRVSMRRPDRAQAPEPGALGRSDGRFGLLGRIARGPPFSRLRRRTLPGLKTRSVPHPPPPPPLASA